ncbi:alginate lyase family protein [Alteromonas lipotrueiana]|uniref:alginate lyase family protein n=1 Tax=Alteromonas lipotrueiana TaxID=2803815 RepID=UPI001C48753D|nr:alginate lyase family protein [Alteromonas lipotrueiana]
MKLFSKKYSGLVFICFSLLVSISSAAESTHPNLVLTNKDVTKMRKAIQEPGRFSRAFESLKQKVDKQLASPMKVPVPKDGGGGYTHEQHKRNYQQMFDAGVIYQLTQDDRYAKNVGEMLLAYAKLYPTLDVHPERKVNSQNPGKLFWQSLNEAVWLVYTIQAYDLVYDALSAEHKTQIETDLLKPVARFLSEGQPSTFNKVHNHGTWATAGVGMAGYVMGEPEWVEKALYDLNKSGKGGFLAQLDNLFSPQGYYNEGPYYQRYALFPFITFAKAIANNEPQRKIFEYRNGIILKAIDTTIQLSYNGLFFPINDAVKSKGIDTIELVHGVTVAYGLTNNPEYLDIADKQQSIILSGDGLKVAAELDANKSKPYQFDSVAFSDGPQGDKGALVIMRSKPEGDQTLLFKPASQGLGHGHFDKLTWQFYDNGNEIVSDYGAARFLNVEAKFGGRYLPENNSYAKQTVAHNTVVVDEKSHFDAKVSKGNQHAPTLNFFNTGSAGSVTQAHIDTAYKDVLLTRTLALVELPRSQRAIGIDLFEVAGDTRHQFDLPLHYHGQLIDTNFKINAFTSNLRALGDDNGYQHLWLKGEGTPKNGLAKVTWLNENGRFYTQTSLVKGQEQFLFTQLGANDPNFNLRNEQGFIRRVTQTQNHRFMSVLEPHGEYNPAKEYTLQATSQLQHMDYEIRDNLLLITLQLAEGNYLIAIHQGPAESAAKQTTFTFKQKDYSLDGRMAVYQMNNKQEY